MIMRNAIDAEPSVVAVDIRDVVERSSPDRAQVRDLQRQLLQRHSLLRLQPVVSSEEVVEAYFRCVITDSLARRYDLSDASLPGCINSSHRAVRRVCAASAHGHARIEDDAWRQGWSVIQHRTPEVNVDVAGRSPKRADLYVVAAERVVSVEFKYVGVAGLRDVGGCAAQLGRHATHHAEAVLVLYSGSGARVPSAVARELEQQAGAANVRILTTVGPEIVVARCTHGAQASGRALG